MLSIPDFQIPRGAIAIVAVVLLAFYLVGGAIYRLYFSPIAKFPGPKLAALTFLYEFYYDIIQDGGGKYIYKIDELHQEYGPIIRINPYELHINDSDFYTEFYQPRSQEKHPWFYQSFGLDDSGFSSVSASLHRSRRMPVNKFFSRQAITKLQPVLQERIDLLCERMKEFKKTRKPLSLHYAFCAIAVDMASKIVFGRPMGNMERTDWGEPFVHSFRSLKKVGVTCRFVPGLLPVMMVLRKSSFKVLQYGGEETKRIVERGAAGHKPSSQPCVMEYLYHSDIAPSEKTLERLQAEGSAIQSAGIETVADALSHMIFHLVNNATMYQRLKKELEAAIPDPESIPAWHELEDLPFLTAVIKEGLRLSLGSSGRLPRVFPNEDIKYREWVIPAGAAVGMSTRFVSRDESIFPDALRFDPERWLQGDVKWREKYLVVFSKGPRMCLGMNLAWEELYLTLSTIFRRFDFDLYETTLRDMEYAHDFISPVYRSDSKCLRVLVS